MIIRNKIQIQTLRTNSHPQSSSEVLMYVKNRTLTHSLVDTHRPHIDTHIHKHMHTHTHTPSPPPTHTHRYSHTIRIFSHTHTYTQTYKKNTLDCIYTLILASISLRSCKTISSRYWYGITYGALYGIPSPSTSPDGKTTLRPTPPP